jgi:chorismate mutase/prephenate dehydratase
LDRGIQYTPEAFFQAIAGFGGHEGDGLSLDVAFQGEHGAYSELAAQVLFGDSVSTRPCKTLKQVVTAVEDRSVGFGVLPAENSLEGSVNQTYDLLLQTSMKICAEVKFRVTHCLLALPGTKLDDIRAVYSHPQALAQCSAFLETLQVVAEPVYDTAGSAKLIRDRNMRDAAAIASEKAATLYGLGILQREIEDYYANITRFLVISDSEAKQTGNDKTSIVFGTKHSPGSLQRALNELAARGINLTKIESRPIKGTPWQYHFFVDFEGHHTDLACYDALEALERSATFLKVLGSYPAATA